MTVPGEITVRRWVQAIRVRGFVAVPGTDGYGLVANPLFCPSSIRDFKRVALSRREAYLCTLGAARITIGGAEETEEVFAWQLWASSSDPDRLRGFSSVIYPALPCNVVGQGRPGCSTADIDNVDGACTIGGQPMNLGSLSPTFIVLSVDGSEETRGVAVGVISERRATIPLADKGARAD